MLQRATARCTGSRGFLEEGLGAESLLGVQGLANPAEFKGIQRYSPGSKLVCRVEMTWTSLLYEVSCDSDPSCSKLGWSWLVCIQQVESSH